MRRVLRGFAAIIDRLASGRRLVGVVGLALIIAGLQSSAAAVGVREGSLCADLSAPAAAFLRPVPYGFLLVKQGVSNSLVSVPPGRVGFYAVQHRQLVRVAYVVESHKVTLRIPGAYSVIAVGSAVPVSLVLTGAACLVKVGV